MQKPQFANNEIYHIYNRGVEKRQVFLEDRDYLRFIHDLFEFNDIGSASPSNIRLATRQPSQCLEVQLPNIDERKPRKLLVEILAFCLMPNHFHLLLKQLVVNGVVKFMQKLGTGYTNYFNIKRERVGPLFQGRFKAVLIKNDSHLRHIPHYIHLNPLDSILPEWRENKIKSSKKAIAFLENYRWSSLRDYIGVKNFPSVTHNGLILDLSGGTKEYRRSIEDWMKEMDLEKIREIILE